MSVKSYLTSGASVRPENTVTYPAGTTEVKICGVFFEIASSYVASTSVVRVPGQYQEGTDFSVDPNDLTRLFLYSSVTEIRCSVVRKSGHYPEGPGFKSQPNQVIPMTWKQTTWLNPFTTFTVMVN